MQHTSLLETTQNTRDLGGYRKTDGTLTQPLSLVRSDVQKWECTPELTMFVVPDYMGKQYHTIGTVITDEPLEFDGQTHITFDENNPFFIIGDGEMSFREYMNGEFDSPFNDVTMS